MMNTNPKTEIIFAHFKIDEQLSDILLVATDLYSRLDSLIPDFVNASPRNHP